MAAAAMEVAMEVAGTVEERVAAARVARAAVAPTRKAPPK